MTVNDTEREGEGGKKRRERERERKKRVGIGGIKNGGKKGRPHHQQLPPNLKAMVIKSYVAIREVECPPQQPKREIVKGE